MAQGKPATWTGMTARVSRRVGPFQIGGAQVARCRVDVGEHRPRPDQHDGLRGGSEGVGRHDHVVAGTDTEHAQGEVERGGAGAQRQRVGHAQTGGERAARTPPSWDRW